MRPLKKDPKVIDKLSPSDAFDGDMNHLLFAVKDAIGGITIEWPVSMVAEDPELDIAQYIESVKARYMESKHTRFTLWVQSSWELYKLYASSSITKDQYNEDDTLVPIEIFKSIVDVLEEVDSQWDFLSV